MGKLHDSNAEPGLTIGKLCRRFQEARYAQQDCEAIENQAKAEGSDTYWLIYPPSRRTENCHQRAPISHGVPNSWRAEMRSVEEERLDPFDLSLLGQGRPAIRSPERYLGRIVLRMGRRFAKMNKPGSSSSFCSKSSEVLHWVHTQNLVIGRVGNHRRALFRSFSSLTIFSSYDGFTRWSSNPPWSSRQ